MKKIFFSLLTVFSLSHQSQATTVIDPANLAQNIKDVIINQINSKIHGDQKEIANSQLKTETQTTADVIGTNSTVKTNLNVSMAEFNYENTPSDLYKSYYKNLNVREKNYKVSLYLGRVKTFYQDNMLLILSPARNDAYIKRFNGLSEAIQEADLLFADFTNTVDNQSGVASTVDNTGGTYNSSTSSSSGSGLSNIDTKALQKEFNKNLGGINEQIANLEKEKAKLDDTGFLGIGGLDDGGKKVIADRLNTQIAGLTDQLDELSSSFQDAISGSISGALGGVFGGVFGGNAAEKGKGQTIKIAAPMGRMSDAERINFATKAFKNLDVVDYQIALLHQELMTLKSDYDLKKYVDKNKFSTAGFYLDSGAMDATKMMNFDKE